MYDLADRNVSKTSNHTKPSMLCLMLLMMLLQKLKTRGKAEHYTVLQQRCAKVGMHNLAAISVFT